MGRSSSAKPRLLPSFALVSTPPPTRQTFVTCTPARDRVKFTRPAVRHALGQCAVMVAVLPALSGNTMIVAAVEPMAFNLGTRLTRKAAVWFHEEASKANTREALAGPRASRFRWICFRPGSSAFPLLFVVESPPISLVAS
jgi:hypothetical protein